MLRAVLYAAWLVDGISALVYRVHVRVSKEGPLQPLSISQVVGPVAPRHFSSEMDEKEKDLEKGQVESGRGPIVEVSLEPSALQYLNWRSKVSSFICPLKCLLSFSPSLFSAVSCSCVCWPLSSIFHSTVSAVQ